METKRESCVSSLTAGTKGHYTLGVVLGSFFKRLLLSVCHMHSGEDKGV